VSLGADFSLRGTPFVRPASCWGVAADGDRLAGALLSAGAHRQGDDEIRYALEPGCVDLSRVRAGRAPLLLEHRPYLDSLAGLVLDAWLDGPLLCCTARVARGGPGDEAWNWLSQGLPLSLSMGAAIVDAEPVGPSPYGGTSFRVSRWALEELSLVVRGKDEHAHLRRLDASENRGWLARKAAGAPEEARRAVHARLHLDKWETWSTGAGLAIAAGLGADPDRVCDLLEEQVRRQVERLQDELAA
jgi:hypothetical protein